MNVKISSVNHVSQYVLSLLVQIELCNGYRVRSSCDVSLVLTKLLSVNQVTHFISRSR